MSARRRQPDDEGELEQTSSRRRLARVVGVLGFVVVAVSFVVENAQPVKVRFWFVTSRPRLIYVVVACLVAGILFGLVLGRQMRRRRAERRGLLRRRD